MKTPHIGYFSLAAVLSFFLISIASAGMESNAQDEEARAQAKAFYDRTVKQCGDLHYVWLEWPSSFMRQPPYWVLVQYKGLNIQRSPPALLARQIASMGLNGRAK